MTKKHWRRSETPGQTTTFEIVDESWHQGLVAAIIHERLQLVGFFYIFVRMTFVWLCMH